MKPATDPRKVCTEKLRLLHRATATLLGAPVSCFPYPTMLTLLHEGVWLLLPLPGNRWGRTLHMADLNQVPGPKLITAAFLDTFFFQILLLVLFHFRDLCLILYTPRKWINVFEFNLLSPDTLWVRSHSLPYASKKWPLRKATGTVISPW